MSHFAYECYQLQQNCLMMVQNTAYRQRIVEMTKNTMMSEFTGERIVERMTEKDLMKIEKIMKKHPTLTITTFLRIFRNMLKPTPQEDFYLTYGLFRFFQEICVTYKQSQITFEHLYTSITEKMPYFSEEACFSQKMYPLSFNIPDNIKKKIVAPEVIGKVLQERERLEERPYSFDKFIHFNRLVAQSFYSPKYKMYITRDNSSTEIMLLNNSFDLIRSVHTELQLSKRDSVVLYMAWSEQEARLAALLGNYSISMWAMEDNFRFELNVGLPTNLLLSPYAMIGYMQSCNIWYTLDNRPSIYILSPKNYEPQYVFTHFKIVKEKEHEKVMMTELKYRKLLCVAFETNIFLISLEKRELLAQFKNFTTTITSLAFSETYQALFVSNFENTFHSFQLSEHLDLTQKGKFEGHKNYVTLLGVLEDRPVVYSIDKNSVAKLWDIRDLNCYQTFTALKNTEFNFSLTLPEGVCFVGSKHFYFRWQRYHMFQQSEKVIYITSFEKNILITTSREVRIYSHSNGVLVKVLKGIFNESLIVRAKLIEPKKILLFISEEGVMKLYSTKDFKEQNSFSLPPKPFLISYEKQTQLLSLVCMGQVLIYKFNNVVSLILKRRIYNRSEIIKFCQISPLHDMIAFQYVESSFLMLYSYERGKFIAYLDISQLVTLKFVGSRNIMVVLSKQQLMVLTYRWTAKGIIFQLRAQVELWQQIEIQQNNIQFHFKDFSRIESTDMTLFQTQIVITSNDACFHCIVKYNFERLGADEIKSNPESFPYRVGSEDHKDAFDSTKRADIIERYQSSIILQKRYIKHPGNRTFVLLAKINWFYCVADQHEVLFYNQESIQRGIIDITQMLPLSWDLHNYSEEEFKQLQFVLEFIQQEQPKEESSVKAAESPGNSKGEVITISMLLQKEKAKKGNRSHSLREKKIVLQKERDEKEKEENFQQMKKAEELVKLQSIHLSSNEKYVSESIAFLNVNRNKLLLNKGIYEAQLPQVRALEFKLSAMMHRDDKKSILSKHSGGQEFGSPVRKIAHEEISKALPIAQTQISSIKLIKESEKRQSYKQQLKRLDLSLRQSKFKRTYRSGSLPSLRQK